MIRFGPSGIPLSCKGRTLLDGVKDVHKVGLTALEVQFLRMKPRTRPAQEEELGLRASDVEDKFIIGVNRGSDFREIYTEDLDKELEAGDMVHFVQGGVAEEFYRFPKVERISKELDVNLTLHTPYYMKFTSREGELIDKSIRGFKYSSALAVELDADLIVTHLGLRDPDKSTEDMREAVIENLRELRDWINENYKDGPLIGIETQAGDDVFGGLDDILEVCRKVSGTIPVMNFAHMKANGEYDLAEPKDFEEVFDLCKNFIHSQHYINFSGVEIRRDNEYRFTPIKRGDLQFESLAKHLIEDLKDITIISSSPLKEHDAMYMKVIFERIFTKEISKELRRKKKDGG